MKKEETKITCLYDLSHTAAKPLLEQYTYPCGGAAAYQGMDSGVLERRFLEKSMNSSGRMSGYIKVQRYIRAHIWESTSSSEKMRKCATARF